MKKLFLKLSLYGFITFVVLEVLVRIFHLYSETPMRYIDEYGVEKRVPNQIGTNVTGNRRQHVTDFRINENGFNTIRKEISSNDKFKIALVGDSFIEGFHQDYKNSLGRMIEEEMDSVEVYEYGCGGYDMADQLHMINAYKEDFEKIDLIIINFKYENDLERANYTPNHDRIANLNSPIKAIRRNSKILNYLGSLGLINKLNKFFLDKKSVLTETKTAIKYNCLKADSIKIENFKNLMDDYGAYKDKMRLLLNSNKTSPDFLAYCHKTKVDYIDYARTFALAEKEVNLIYDKHWNTYGRTLIAKEIKTVLLNQELMVIE